MSTTTTVSCDACGRSFKWKSELAGKRVKCKCGGRIHFPKDDPAVEAAPEPEEDGLLSLSAHESTPAKKSGTRIVPAIDEPEHSDEPDLTQPKDEGEYDLGETRHSPAAKPAAPRPATGGDTCPHCSKPIPANAVICTSCGTNLKTGKKLGTSVAQERSSPVAASTSSKPRMKGLEWIYIAGGVAVIGIILAILDFSAPETGVDVSRWVCFGCGIIWIIGTVWGIRGACGDNFALRIACRFIPFLGWYMIIKRSLEDWDSMKQPVMTIAFGASSTIIAGVLWMITAFSIAGKHLGHH